MRRKFKITTVLCSSSISFKLLSETEADWRSVWSYQRVYIQVASQPLRQRLLNKKTANHNVAQDAFFGNVRTRQPLAGTDISKMESFVCLYKLLLWLGSANLLKERTIIFFHITLLIVFRTVWEFFKNYYSESHLILIIGITPYRCFCEAPACLVLRKICTK
jgi:hypothetical protein